MSDVQTLLQANVSTLATDSQPTAVIVKGNPKYVDNNADADKLYALLTAILQRKGYQVSYDEGAPYTTPATADLWLGHSRGIDRLRFAPAGTKTIAIGSPGEGGVINHPDDIASKTVAPTAAHYQLTPEMRKAIMKAASADPTLAQLQEAKQLSDRRQYDAKALVLKKMMQAHPEDFQIDSTGKGHPGLTHVPTGFRLHLPAQHIPPTVKSASLTLRRILTALL